MSIIRKESIKDLREGFMSDTNEHRIKLIIIILTVLWHFLMIYAFFFIVRKESDEPMHLTLKPQVIEYLLNSMSQQKPTIANKTLPTLPPALASSIQQIAQNQLKQELDEEGFEQYMLKNAVSYGSYNQGSVVTMGQEGIGEKDEHNSNVQQETGQPQKTMSLPEQDDTAINDQNSNQESNSLPSAEEPSKSQETETSQEQDQSLIDTPSEINPILAQAEQLLNETGSSWISPSKSQSASKTPTQQQRPNKTSSPNTYPKNRQTRPLTLADITQSYVKHIRQEQEVTGHCTYNQGNSSSGSIRHGVYAPPTDATALSEQIYASKLYSLLEQSAKAYSNQIYSCKALEMETTIEVTLEKSGKILDVKLRPELPEKDMERALCLIIQRVGLFPPIPREFRKQKIILSIPIHIRSTPGFASYQLLYGTHFT